MGLFFERTFDIPKKPGFTIGTLLSLLILWGPAVARAQDSISPVLPEAAPGNPGSSYALGGVDSVNYYNGQLNIHIPVATIGARGSASKTLVVPIERLWSATDPSVGAGSNFPYTANEPASASGYAYLPGYLSVVSSSQSGLACPYDDTHWANSSVSEPLPGKVLTWIVWHAPDGTETVLVDTNSNGQPQTIGGSDCGSSYAPASRGTVFRSYDGSGMTYVANSALSDGPISGPSTGTLLGTIYFKDGTQYLIDSSGDAMTIKDRNGNFSQWVFGGGGSSTPNYTVTDSAGRQTVFTFTEDFSTSPQDSITWDGTGGATRQIMVNYAQLHTFAGMPSAGSMPTGACLFPDFPGSFTIPFDPWVVQSIVMPDSTSYQFEYDVYGEVTTMTLPTGAKYTYSYSGTSCAHTANPAGLSVPPSGSSFSGSGALNVGTEGPSIYRPVLERDEYADGSDISGRTVFTAVAGTPAAGQTRMTVQFYDGSTGHHLLKTEYHDFQGDPTAVVSIPTDPTLYPAWNDGMEFQTTVVDPDPTLGTLQTRQVVTGQRACDTTSGYDSSSCALQGNTDVPAAAPPHDPQICQINTTFGAVVFGTPPAYPTSGLTFGYDADYNNQTDLREFDFGSALLVSDYWSCPGAVSGFKRETVTAYDTNTSYAPAAPAVAPFLVSLPTSRTVYGSSGTSGAVVAEDTWAYDGGTIAGASGEPGHDDTNYSATNTVRGNVTTHTVYLSSSGTPPSEAFTYDQTGSVTTHTDFNTNQTTFTYTDSTNSTHVNPDLVLNALDAAHSGSGCTGGWTTCYAYDQNTLKPTSMTDENSTITSYSWEGTAGTLDRLTTVQRGASKKSQTNYSYAAAGTQVTTKQDQSTSDDGNIQAETVYDLLGRPSQSIQYETLGGTITTTQTYDGLGRVVAVSNPARPSDAAYSTTYTFDALGRPLTAVAQDGTSTTNYSYAPSGTTAETVTVKDAGGSTRQMTFDGLGRMTQVVEDPAGLNYSTTYTYDLLDDLTSVAQGSSQSRSFTWNMRGWLTSATNPEVSATTATTWSYDGNGNPLMRVSPAGISTCYSYDSVNRLTSQSYYASGGSCTSNNTSSPATPNVTYSYDSGATNANGRLVSVTNTAAVDAISSYDELGRITGSSQTIGSGGTTRSFTYGYNLADALLSTGYPGGRTVTNAYDVADRVVGITGSKTGTPTVNYIAGGCGFGGSFTGVCYAADGAPVSFSYYNGVARTYSYNGLLQPATITDTLSGSTLFSLNYAFGVTAGKNNGNPSQVAVGGTYGGFTQNYFYDSVNRVCAAAEASSAVSITNCPNPMAPGSGAPTSGVNWAQNLSYDPYGNMWAPAAAQAGLSGVAALGWMPTSQSQITAANNQLSVSGLYYDGGGNQTTFLGTSTSSPIQYDAENRQVQVVDGMGNTFHYTYDGLGERVSRQLGSGTVTNYVHDVFGNLAQEYNPPAAAACTTCYMSWDHLGSTRMVTNSSGAIVARHDYLPFGVEIARSWSVVDGLSPKFTGQDHDTETLLEFYQARYLASGLGRFMSVDPGNAGADLTDPQTWNMYGYVRNNPLKFSDPSGFVTEVPCNSEGVNPNDGSDFCESSGADDDGTDDGGDDFSWWSPPGLQAGGFTTYAGITSTHTDGYTFTQSSSPPSAISDGEPPSACLVANIAAVNSVSDLHVTFGDVSGTPRILNGALNVNFSVAGASPSSLRPGRYPSSFLNRLFGIGSSVHVPPFGGRDPSTYGIDPITGNFTFTTHIDTAYATWHTPIGAFIHFFVDVRDNGAHRRPC